MAGVYDTCNVCGVHLKHAPGRGKATKYCGAVCKSKADAVRLAAKTLAPCCVEGCDKPATRVGARMCEKHYIRRHRNGTTDYVGNALPGSRTHSHGYVLAAAPGHPRALGGYRAYEHRVVFTNAHGEGPFNCHWCHKVVNWGDMHVDHVDANRSNNDLSNLVASCADCNQRRGHDKMRDTVRTRYGITINERTLTPNEWAAEVGISRSTIMARIKAGWDLERAVMTPRGRFGPKLGSTRASPARR